MYNINMHKYIQIYISPNGQAPVALLSRKCCLMVAYVKSKHFVIPAAAPVEIQELAGR